MIGKGTNFCDYKTGFDKKMSLEAYSDMALCIVGCKAHDVARHRTQLLWHKIPPEPFPFREVFGFAFCWT